MQNLKIGVANHAISVLAKAIALKRQGGNAAHLGTEVIIVRSCCGIDVNLHQIDFAAIICSRG